MLVMLSLMKRAMSVRRGCARLAIASAAAACTAVLTSAVCVPLRAASADRSLRDILEGCRESDKSVRTSKGTFTIEFEDSGTGSGPMGPRYRFGKRLEGSWVASDAGLREETVRFYPELTPAEQRLLDEEQERWRPFRSGPAPPPHGELSQIVVFDGSRCRVVTHQNGVRDLDQLSEGTSAAATARGMSEFWKWLGLTPVGAEGRRVVEYPTAELSPEIIGREKIDGVECIKVRSGHASLRGEVIWWVAPSYGYLVLRMDQVVYFQPGGGLEAGQHALIRRRVSDVASFAGVHLPRRVEKVVAWVNSDGSVAHVLRRWHFVADTIEVNGPVSRDSFSMEKLPDKYSESSAGSAQPSTCGYSALIDFCSLLGVELDSTDKELLAELYAESAESSFADLAAHFEGITGVPLVGYRGTPDDLVGLNQPFIAHLRTGEGAGHFVTVENTTADLLRILDLGVMHIYAWAEFEDYFTGRVLAVDAEAVGDSANHARVLCPVSILTQGDATPCAEGHQYEFRVSNAGAAVLTLAEAFRYPSDLAAKLVIPAEVAPRSSTTVVVELRTVDATPLPWAVVLATNDPLRPALWLGSSEPAAEMVRISQVGAAQATAR